MKRNKFKIKRIKPITILPKLKELSQTKFLHKNHSLKKQNLKNWQLDKEKNEEMKNSKKDTKVEFNNQNSHILICEELLKKGYLESYHDFYKIFLEKEEKINLLTKEIEFIKIKLINIEKSKIEKNYLDYLKISYELAEKYLDIKKSISKFFFEKILNSTEKIQLLITDKKTSKSLQEWYLKAKLGFIKCLDFWKESELAIKLLEEAFQSSKYSNLYKEQISEQLIDLQKKLAEKEENKENYDKALNHYNKCLNACKKVNNFELETEIALKVFQVHINKGDFKIPIDISKKYLANSHKLPKEKVLNFEIQCYKILAECYYKLNDFEEAENYYKNYYELLKNTEDTKMLNFKSEGANKLGRLFWTKGNKKQSVRYLEEFFDFSLRIDPKNRDQINESRVSLGIVQGLDSYSDFMEYLNMSKNKINDIINFKKTGRFS